MKTQMHNYHVMNKSGTVNFCCRATSGNDAAMIAFRLFGRRHTFVVVPA